MFTVIGFMITGIVCGILLRRQELRYISKIVTLLIWLLLFILGIEVGHNREVMQSLPTLGLEGFFIATTCLTGSCIAAWGLWYYIYKRKKKKG